MRSTLQPLLDFSSCNSSNAILGHARLIAEELFSNWSIKSLYGEHRLYGIEFYIYIPELHEDSAVHRREEQLQSGTFYFHTKSKKPNWSPPIFNRHGVDITCGNAKRGIYGGILLRHVGGEGHRDGSGVGLRAIMRGDSGFKTIRRGSNLVGWSKEEINLFERCQGQSIFEGEISLKYSPCKLGAEIAAKKRIGIENTSHSSELLRFVIDT